MITQPEEEDQDENEVESEIEDDTVVSPVSPLTPALEEATKSKTTPEPGYIAPSNLRTSMEREGDARLEEVIKEGSSPPMSPTKGGVKGWLKTKFRRSKDIKSPESKDAEEKSFTGGAALTAANTNSGGTGSSSIKESSMKDVALAGMADKDTAVDDIAPAGEDSRLGRSKRRASSVSSLSVPGQDIAPASSQDDEFEEARDNFDDALAPPPTFTATKTASPVRDSKFKEVI